MPVELRKKEIGIGGTDKRYKMLRQTKREGVKNRKIPRLVFLSGIGKLPSRL